MKKAKNQARAKNTGQHRTQREVKRGGAETVQRQTPGCPGLIIQINKYLAIKAGCTTDHRKQKKWFHAHRCWNERGYQKKYFFVIVRPPDDAHHAIAKPCETPLLLEMTA